MREANPYEPTKSRLQDDSPKKRNKHLRTIVGSISLLFTVPIMLWMYYKIDTSNIDTLQYYSTKISTIAAVASIFGPWIGVYISAYSMLLYRPKRILLYPIYALIHASIWLVLCYSFANAVILWKYRPAFPAKWQLNTCVIAFIEFYIYALLFLFIIHVSIWLYDKYTNSGLTNRSTRTLPPLATSSASHSAFSSPSSAPQSAPPVNSIR